MIGGAGAYVVMQQAKRAAKLAATPSRIGTKLAVGAALLLVEVALDRAAKRRAEKDKKTK